MKKLLFKLSFFLSLIMIGQIMIYTTFESLEDNFYLQGLRTAERLKADIIFLGDSSIDFLVPSDHSHLSIAQFLQMRLPGKTVYDLSSTGNKMDIYYALCRHIRKSHVRPHTIIIPIALNSFGIIWDLDPNQQFIKEKLCINHDFWLFRVFLKPLEVFRVIKLSPDLDLATYYNLQVYFNGYHLGRVLELKNHVETDEHTSVMKDTILGFMGPLTAHHRIIKDMAAISHLFDNTDTRVLFYISPYDYQLIRKHLGDAPLITIQNNINLIRSNCVGRNVDFLDLGTVLTPDEFEKPDLITNHMNATGRRKVADYLLKTMAP